MAAESMAAWLQAGLAQALRLKYMDHLRLTAPGAIDDAKKKAHHPMFALQQDPILWRGCISEHFPEFDMWLEGQLAEWQARSSGSGSSSGQLQ
ncbi:hypothetical protein Agub_g2813 [Astrephomene gubernaculifera]|uniref:Uncharacterized protein n=1 Tax=Astrephomene gubernaculifera TaxID=47775 RepID=A0AAD3DHM5_9CHLO|nr:hypothetical protein Agub_g2813 [Astrephomene gubernaculifera]